MTEPIPVESPRPTVRDASPANPDAPGTPSSADPEVGQPLGWRRLVFLTLTPGVVYRLAGWGRSTGRGRLAVVEQGRGSARLRYSGADDDPLQCADRQRWALRVVARYGGRRRTLREGGCIARGAPACEYAVVWSDGPRALPAVLAGTVTLLGLVVASLSTSVPALAWLLIPAAVAAAYLLERKRTAGVEYLAGAESQAAFRWVMARALAARSELRTQPDPAHGAIDAPLSFNAPRSDVPALEQVGEIWRISYDGTTVLLRHSRGLVLLAHLVRCPGTNVHVRDLDAITPSGGSPVARDASAPQGDALPVPGDAGELLDERARAEYRRRIIDLRADLEDAERCHDLGRTDALRAEIDLIADELRTATAAHGRGRRASADIERLRLAITSRIRAAITQIAKHHPTLGEHLAATVSTGYHCAYMVGAAAGSPGEPAPR
jgi:hypothetical protein